jgi:hypothetical protein
LASEKKNNPNTQSKWLLWLGIAVAVLLITGGAVMLFNGNSAASGTPRVVVEQPVIDVGYQAYKTQVQNDFKISNTGDGPLTILGEPEVELVEGC